MKVTIKNESKVRENIQKIIDNGGVFPRKRNVLSWFFRMFKKNK